MLELNQIKYFSFDENLTEPIDVFSEWIDACEEANKGNIPTFPPINFRISSFSNEVKV